MKFPDCTVVSINMPNELLEVIDTRATKRILNRSACVRELVTEALRDSDSKVIAFRYAESKEPLSS
jgi:metal-responsive CopG/Arc/MetJ family transcriptional regulator